MAELPEFLTLADVAEILKTSNAQVYALLKRGDLRAMKLGGRGQWRISVADLESYIAQQYAQTERFIDEAPAGDAVDADEPTDVADVAEPVEG